MIRWTPLVAILAIAGLETFALSRGIDGVALSASVGAIGAAAGYAFARPRSSSPSRKDENHGE